MMPNGKNGQLSNDCFVLMPIADPDGYEKGHFKKVYDDIFKVAIEKAGFNPVRADDVKETNLIHLDILQKLIESPMAICDLSSRNPNVLFELGLRQAFDKPTILVQEKGTPAIFDISPMRYTEYRKELKYRDVLEDQKFIAEAIIETQKATKNGKGVNSLIGLLSITSPAKLKDVSDNDTAKMLQVVMSQISDLRSEVRESKSAGTVITEPQYIYFTKKDMDNLIKEMMVKYKWLEEAVYEKEDIPAVDNAYADLQGFIDRFLMFDPPQYLKDKIMTIKKDADKVYNEHLFINKKEKSR